MSILALVDDIDPDFTLLSHHLRRGTFDDFLKLVRADFPSGQQVIGF